MITDPEGVTWPAITSWLLAIILLFVGLTVGEPRGSGMIDPGVIGFTIFLVVCVPLFGFGIIFGGIAIRQGQPWGYGSVLLNVIVMGTLLFWHLTPGSPESPQARGKRMQQMQQRERAAQRARENAGIAFSENSAVYQIVTSPWWRPGCASVVVVMTLIWAGRRLTQRLAIRLPNPHGKSASSERLTLVCCPKCRSDITGILATGGSICPECGIQFILARGDSTNANPPRDSALASLLFDGPAGQRLTALLCVSLLAILGLVWVGLMLAGQWIASKNILVVMFILALSLGAILAHYSRRQN